jgi:hypothetical protein
LCRILAPIGAGGQGLIEPRLLLLLFGR